MSEPDVSERRPVIRTRPFGKPRTVTVLACRHKPFLDQYTQIGMIDDDQSA
jgi:hypothetical protein